MAVTHLIDDDRRRVHIRIDGSTNGAAASGVIVALADARSELLDYDFVIDIRDASGDVNNNDVDQVATSFAAHPSVPTYTVFITQDRSFADWARVMDFQFQNRKHHVVSSPEEAEALLERLRPEVLPAPAPK